jgi:hypothetical protein
MFDEGHLKIRSTHFSRGVGVISIDKQNTYTLTLNFQDEFGWFFPMLYVFLVHCGFVTRRKLGIFWIDAGVLGFFSIR